MKSEVCSNMLNCVVEMESLTFPFHTSTCAKVLFQDQNKMKR